MPRVVFAALFLLATATASGQVLLDRVLARVEGDPITLTDARVALGLGIVPAGEAADPIAAALQQLIDRRLLLMEVARFLPPEPDASAVDREVAALKARAGSNSEFRELMKNTGLDEARVREIARDNLRIQAYVTQRFGVTVQASAEEAARYYREHPDEFRRDGALLPFDLAEPTARQKASAERRERLIAQWMRDLRARANVIQQYRR